MSKKYSLKSSGKDGGTAVSRHVTTSTSSAGGNSLKSDHRVANDGKGNAVAPGQQYGRYISTKPSASSGTVGSGQPLKTAAAKQYENPYPSTQGKGTYRTTKPKR